MRSLCQTNGGRALLRRQQPERVSYRQTRTQTVTDNHPYNTEEATAYEASHIAYSALENVRPAKFGDDTWSYVPKRDDTFRGGWGHEVESGRENNNI
jgi:hypothetical protein